MLTKTLCFNLPKFTPPREELLSTIGRFCKELSRQRQSFNDLWLPTHYLFSLRLLQVFFAR
jgi:hypothetical protein